MGLNVRLVDMKIDVENFDRVARKSRKEALFYFDLNSSLAPELRLVGGEQKQRNPEFAT